MMKILDNSGDSMTVKVDMRFVAGFFLGVVITYLVLKKFGYLNPGYGFYNPYFGLGEHSFNSKEKCKTEPVRINLMDKEESKFSEYEM